MNFKLLGLALIISFIGGCGDEDNDEASPDAAPDGDTETDTDTDADTDTDTDTDADMDGGTETDGGTDTDTDEAGVCGAGTVKLECECGDIVGGNFTFTNDLVCPTGLGLIIGADDIVVDGAGYLLDGAEATGCMGFDYPDYDHLGIYNAGFDNVTIKNLEIKNFCKGIFVMGVPVGMSENAVHCCDEEDPTVETYPSGIIPAENNLIEGNRIHHCGDGAVETNDNGILLMYSVTGAVIQKNEIHNISGLGEDCSSGGNAVYVEGPDTDYNTIAENIFYKNRKDGLMMKMKSDHNDIIDNEAYENGRCGFSLRCKLSNDNIIEGNYVHDNGGDGIFIGGHRNLIQYNTVLNNRAEFLNGQADILGDGDGINLGRNEGSRDNEVKENEVCGNEGFDINVVDETYGNFGNNNTCDTADNYYDDDGITACTFVCGSGRYSL